MPWWWGGRGRRGESRGSREPGGPPSGAPPDEAVSTRRGAPPPGETLPEGPHRESPYRGTPVMPTRARARPRLDDEAEPLRPAHELAAPPLLPPVPPPPPALRSVPPRLVEEDSSLLAELMQDPQEMRLLGPLLGGRPMTDAERAAYRDFLLGRGDVRGEVLTLIDELAMEPPPPDAEHRRARLSELVPRVRRGWLRMMSELPYLLNCGLARQQHPGVRFAFACPRSWEELAPTQQPGVRHCSGCGEDVHRADTLIAAEHLARQRRCIAVPSKLTEQGGYPEGRRLMLGRPEHPVRKWSTQLFGERPSGGE